LGCSPNAGVRLPGLKQHSAFSESDVPRDNWSGRLGFVLAASGSAIGLGNLWKFPYIAWQNSGGAFVLVYLACIAVVGLPIMCAEILIGRHAQASVAAATAKLGLPRWNVIGWLSVFTGFVILGFYSVIAGWSLSSFWQCLNWSIYGYQAPAESAFGEFLGHGSLQLVLTAAFSLATALIVARGISHGIERAAKILMPTLLAILFYLLVNVMLMSGFSTAMRFLFVPELGKLTAHGVLEALGHAFFTLSLGMGAMITYGSYMTKKEAIIPVSLTVVALDTLIALMACMIMYTIIFSVPGLSEQVGRSTVGMLFITLPKMFYTYMPGGAIVGPLFYVLVAFAALSSTISLLEVTTALFVDKYGWRRVTATAVAAGGTYGLSVLAALSLGAVGSISSFKLFGSHSDGIWHTLNVKLTGDKAGVLSILDHVSANWLLPLGGLLITLFVGWALPKRISMGELFPYSTRPPFLYRAWLFFVRFVAPGAIGWIIVRILFYNEDFS
jgi:NSS family neurotransmitter:Na+ symporter